MVGVLILAGGQGRRMGGQDKGWVTYQERPMIEQLLSRVQQQLELFDSQDYRIVISANRNLARYQALGFPVVADIRQGYCGPLSGIESILSYDDFEAVSRWIVCPVDSPELSHDYVHSMLQLETETIGYLVHDGRAHYAHLSLPSSVKTGIVDYLEQGGRSIKGWLSQQAVTQSITLKGTQQPILNINH